MFHGLANGANNKHAKQAGNEDRSKRSDDKIQNIRNNVLKSLLGLCSDIRNNKSGKHRALITYNIPLKTKRMESDCLNRTLNHIIRVRKKRVHQHETKDDADDGATTKLLHARPCNKHGQKGKSSFHQNGRDRQNVGVHLNAKRVDAVNEAAKKACCH